MDSSLLGAILAAGSGQVTPRHCRSPLRAASFRT